MDHKKIINFSFFKKKKTPFPLILPFIKPLRWFESYALAGNEFRNIFFMPFEADLGIGFCLNAKEDEPSVIYNDYRKTLQYSDEELLAFSIKNLLEQTKLVRDNYSFESTDVEIWSSEDNHLSNSGLMLLKREVVQLPIKGKPILFFMGRDQVLITGHQDQENILNCINFILSNHNNSLLSGEAYVLDGEWRKTTFKACDSTIINDYRINSMSNYLVDTNKFLDVLAEKNELSDDFLIPQVNFDLESGQPILYSIWHEAQKNWIAKVDKLILLPLDKQHLIDKELDKLLQEYTFDWSIVQEVYSQHMKELDYFHEVWEFKSFPSLDELEVMKKLQQKKIDR